VPHVVQAAPRQRGICTHSAGKGIAVQVGSPTRATARVFCGVYRCSCWPYLSPLREGACITHIARYTAGTSVKPRQVEVALGATVDIASRTSDGQQGDGTRE